MSIKKTISIIANDIHSDINQYTILTSSELCHWLCSYTFFLNIPVAGYIYSYNKQEQNIFDMTGIVILSLTSYMYHYDVYKSLILYKDEQYLYPQKYNYRYFINDNIAIHLRCFFTLLTNYYRNPFLYAVMSVSILFHSVGVYHAVMNVIDSLVDINYDKNNFFMINNIIISMPVTFDLFVVYMNTSKELSDYYLCTNILLTFVIYAVPLFKMNHVAIHSALLLQTYYLCLSNIQQII